MAESPWAELARLEDIIFDRADLPQGVEAVHWSDGVRTVILLDRSLLRPQRRAALAHELEHHRRGGRPLLPWMTGRDERQVDDCVAERLVAASELRVFIEARVGAEVGVTVWEVAEHFDVPDDVALRALELLRTVDD